MRLVIQRVNHACVRVDGNVIGSIGRGFLILLGVANGDTKEMADKYVKKLSTLRIFEDADGKTNLSLADVGGEVLVVSQFTLTAKRATDRVSSMREHRILQMICMSISRKNVLKCSERSSAEVSEPI
jgi:D-tyrosyl-tRNA(Tyr) deacylase